MTYVNTTVVIHVPICAEPVWSDLWRATVLSERRTWQQRNREGQGRHTCKDQEQDSQPALAVSTTTRWRQSPQHMSLLGESNHDEAQPEVKIAKMCCNQPC